MKRGGRWPFVGFVLGALVGATILTVNVVGASSPDQATAPVSTFGEILHTPALLAPAGEPVELNYDFVCGAGKDEPGRRCSAEGSVFYRPVGASTFSELALKRKPGGPLAAVVPGRHASLGFDYFARFDNGRGETGTLPEAGADAPQHVWALADWATVDLGTERFGDTRRPSSVVASFGWGKGDGALGLDSGREQSRIGPSAFDVSPDGAVVLLDQVNRRLVRIEPGGGVSHVPIPFSGGEGDVAVAGDGSIYVLDSSNVPMLRSFTARGDSIASTPLGERTADMVRIGPGGPLVHAYPSEMWLPTGAGRPPLTPEAQRVAAEPARSVGDGLGVVVHAEPAEAMVALVRGDRVIHAWRLRCATSLGEVQLAEPYGDGLLVVVRLWDEKHAQFRVLRLRPEGLAESFSLETAEWAESGSLSRFRLHGHTLYQLRSGPAGAEIATFEIGGQP